MGGSFVERSVPWAFNTLKINTAQLWSITSPLSSPLATASQAPFITIPAGISPTALLDSQIVLHNSQAEPSPPSGTFQLSPSNHESSMLDPVTAAADGDNATDDSFHPSVQLHGRHPVPSTHVSGLESKVSSPYKDAPGPEGVFSCQTLSSMQPAMNRESGVEFPKVITRNCATEPSLHFEVSRSMVPNADCLASQPCRTDRAGDQMSQQGNHTHGGDSHFLEPDQKGAYRSMGLVRTSEDGYNWRKYGQKQVKGSEYPRSYYKCTHPNCLVKKKIEHCEDGQIAEIIYKGAHNHPKPHPGQSTLCSSFPYNDTSQGSLVKVVGGAGCGNIQLQCNDIKVDSDRRADSKEKRSSTSILTDNSDPLSTTQGKCIFESVGTAELASRLATCNGDDEDRATRGSKSLIEDAADNEPEPKRRKMDSSLMETSLASRAAREPRVVLQIESEVDILDDGYHWRKYGQKVVKGNPNPRGYYKCTSTGCPVRKHVERACHDPKSVITRYEGKHNHEVPAAKNSGLINLDARTSSSTPSSTRAELTSPRNTIAPLPEPQLQDLAPRFQSAPDPGSDFMLGNLISHGHETWSFINVSSTTADALFTCWNAAAASQFCSSGHAK